MFRLRDVQELELLARTLKMIPSLKDEIEVSQKIEKLNSEVQSLMDEKSELETRISELRQEVLNETANAGEIRGECNRSHSGDGRASAPLL